MKTIITNRFTILIADHYGMCFGVKGAIKSTQQLLKKRPATILGQLAHNPTVRSELTSLGAQESSLHKLKAPTSDVIITAHGASDLDRKRWQTAGYRVTDTTCPLVKVAHQRLKNLVTAGYFPVIIGKPGHTEVRGLQGDFPHALVIPDSAHLHLLPTHQKIGIISQTTQPITKVRALVDEIRKSRPESEIIFCDTVCQPTKDRQRSLTDLCQTAHVIIAVGGKDSNNTAQLARTAQRLGCRAHHIESASELKSTWFHPGDRIGLTAGTSTLDHSVEEVLTALKKLGNTKNDRLNSQATCFTTTAD